MKQFTSEEIQAQFEKLPKDLQEAVASASITESIELIGKKYELHVDQIGELIDLVGMIMFGLIPSGQFIKNFSSNSGVKTDIARSIAEDINSEIFSKLKTTMRTAEEVIEKKNLADLAALEKAGGFTIEREGNAENTSILDSSSIGSNNSTEPNVLDVDKASILNDIEYPTASREVSGEKYIPHTEPLVDLLLSIPTTSTEKKVSVEMIHSDSGIKNSEKTPPTPPPIQKPKAADLYREATK